MDTVRSLESIDFSEIFVNYCRRMGDLVWMMEGDLIRLGRLEGCGFSFFFPLPFGFLVSLHFSFYFYFYFYFIILGG